MDMEILINLANILIAVLALIVAIIAIIISACQANKSNKISLMGLRIDFYNKICNLLLTYKPLLVLKEIPKIKGKNTAIEIILSRLGEGNTLQERLSSTFEKIISDINYLDVNKYLFNQVISSEITHMVDALELFKKVLSNFINNKNTENNLLDAAELLSNYFTNKEKELLEQIKTTVAVKYKKSKL